MTDSKVPALAMFPGQGSQKVGMGKELSAQSEVARSIFERADKALGFSLSQICFEGPAEKLTATEIAQPAILTVSVICFELAKATLDQRYSIVAAAGHSLGEYSALVAAGALTFEDAVRLVNKRGKFMQEAVPAGAGSMVAVIGSDVPAIESALAKVTKGVAEIANVNAPGQIVVAGKKEAIDEFVAIMAGTRIMPLQVSAPFHCSLMEPAAVRLAEELDSVKISDAAFPIISNVTAMPHQRASELRENLKKQVCGRVRWVESMQRAFESKPEVALEFGSGNVLGGLLKRIEPGMKRADVGSLANIGLL